MTITVKSKTPLVVPPAVRRLAGLKSGQELEFKVAGGTITIAPKLSPDEIQDEHEIRDPKIREAIREGYREFLAGKTSPIEEFLAKRARKRSRPRA
jgi:bifunctional DNA-binding transcriptional regulator/antitoxin component of YhaV-PrlF toxin-antitoxin module